jgi:hypothetical protein
MILHSFDIFRAAIDIVSMFFYWLFCDFGHKSGESDIMTTPVIAYG